MEDIKNALLRSLGIVLMVLGAMLGAATCGDYWGQNHPVDNARHP